MRTVRREPIVLHVATAHHAATGPAAIVRPVRLRPKAAPVRIEVRIAAPGRIEAPIVAATEAATAARIATVAPAAAGPSSR